MKNEDFKTQVFDETREVHNTEKTDELIEYCRKSNKARAEIEIARYEGTNHQKDKKFAEILEQIKWTKTGQPRTETATIEDRKYSIRVQVEVESWRTFFNENEEIDSGTVVAQSEVKAVPIEKKAEQN